MSETKPPSFARIKRVNDIVTADKALKPQLSEKTEAVEKRNGTTVKFSPEIVKIAAAIAAAGQDSCAINKAEILKHAQTVIEGGEVTAKPAEATAPAAKDADNKKNDTPKPAPAAKSSGRIKVDRNIGILSLLLSAEQIAEHDQQPGADARRKALGQLTRDYSTTVNGTAA